MIESIEGVQSCKNLTLWEVGKSKYAGIVHIVVRSKANRSMIHDEVSTILRSNKIKKITC
jgi:Co/Zn/Cd efflux system component